MTTGSQTDAAAPVAGMPRLVKAWQAARHSIAASVSWKLLLGAPGRLWDNIAVHVQFGVVAIGVAGREGVALLVTLVDDLSLTASKLMHPG